MIDKQPSEHEPVSYYIDFATGLEPRATKLETDLAVVRWLTGKCINNLLHSKKYKRGDKKRLLEALKLDDATAHRWQTFAATYTEKSMIEGKSYTKMLQEADRTKHGVRDYHAKDAPLEAPDLLGSGKKANKTKLGSAVPRNKLLKQLQYANDTLLHARDTVRGALLERDTLPLPEALKLIQDIKTKTIVELEKQIEAFHLSIEMFQEAAA